MKCPKCGGTNTERSRWLDSWSCNDCPDEFVWTKWQQEEIERLRNAPARCPECRRELQVQLSDLQAGYAEQAAEIREYVVTITELRAELEKGEK